MRSRPRPDLLSIAAGTKPWASTDLAQFVAMAQAHSGCEVLHQDFLSMQLPEGRFDGIFANASLFHVPSQELSRVATGTVRNVEAARCPVLVKSAWKQRRRLERRSLCLLFRPRHLARLCDCGRFRRTRPLLPPARLATRAATLARVGLAQGVTPEAATCAIASAAGHRPDLRGRAATVRRGSGRRDRICLVDRNGPGKSTLLRIAAGLVQVDAGERFAQPGTTCPEKPPPHATQVDICRTGQLAAPR